MSNALLCVCGHSVEDAMDRVDDAAELHAVAESWGSALNDVVSMEDDEAPRQPPYPIEDTPTPEAPAPDEKPPLTKLQAFLADMEAHGAS